MYAQLGNLKFDLITYYEGFRALAKTQYAEHKVIEGKPRIQWIGDELDEISIRLLFHTDFCNPREELLKLKEVFLKHEALDFIFGNGEYKGKFVIEEINSEIKQTFKDGEVMCVEVEIKLREYVEPMVYEFKKAPPAKRSAGGKTQEQKKPKNEFTPGEIVRKK